MRNCHFARSSKPHEGPAICKLGNTFMLSIDWVLEIVHGPLTCHLVKCSMDWASSAVVCPFSLSFQTTYCSDSLIDRVFIKERREIVFLLCGSDESVHMFSEVSGSLFML